MAAAPDYAEAATPFVTATRGISPTLPDSTEIGLSIGGRETYRLALGSLRALAAAAAKARGQS
jgi:hypothetical protein